MTGDSRPFGRGRCPECGAQMSCVLPGEVTSETLPGKSCVKCGYGETYYPPSDDENDLRDWC